jgi:hypothetical protein
VLGDHGEAFLGDLRGELEHKRQVVGELGGVERVPRPRIDLLHVREDLTPGALIAVAVVAQVQTAPPFEVEGPGV